MSNHKSKKKFAAAFVILALLLTASNNIAFAQQLIKKLVKPAVQIQKTPCQIPIQLENNIKNALASVYGADKVNEMYPRILSIIEKAKHDRKSDLKKEDISRSDDWFKNEVIYMFYADQFGIKHKGQSNTFKDLVGMLDYLQDLGVTTIYILPFMDSPMGDAGFDVKDPKNIRKDLGGMDEFRKFASEARKRGLKIKADLILNHISDQHEWFQQALKGDTKKLDYFITLDHPPIYKKYLDKEAGITIDYTEDNGLISKRRIIFPEICENNYRKVTINGKDYYVYHTFYPFQLDINWKNPDVLYYMLDVIAYWANQGIDIFRLDAIPFLIKEKGTDGENSPQTHEEIKLLSSFLQAIAPRSVIQAEVCQCPNDLVPYFGHEETINLDDKRKLTRTDEVQIAYNFPDMPALWASMLTENKDYFWKIYNITPKIPDSSTWATFLRIYDELTLEMVDEKTRKIIYNKLMHKGAEFRKGFGIGGRMANFLDKNPKRIELAFATLFSLPGIPIIYYGDEIGALNNWPYAKDAAKKREKSQKAKAKELELLSYFDARDINRGPLLKNDLYDALKETKGYNGEIYHLVKNLIKVRKQSLALTRGTLTEVKSDKYNIFSYLRQFDTEKVLVVNNLSGRELKTTLSLPESVMIDKAKSLNDMISNDKVQADLKGNSLKLTLKPYQALWIKL